MDGEEFAFGAQVEMFKTSDKINVEDFEAESSININIGIPNQKFIFDAIEIDTKATKQEKARTTIVSRMNSFSKINNSMKKSSLDQNYPV